MTYSDPSHGELADVKYLRSLPSIRARCGEVYEAAKKGKTQHFTVCEDKIGHVVDLVLQSMEREFPGGASTVPFHSRWRHFTIGGIDRVEQLQKSWDADAEEVCRRLLDLSMVSVLLDAGAGPTWKYVEGQNGQVFARSEGLAVASFHMFCQGKFSSNKENPYQVDAAGLSALSVADLQAGFQVDEGNPLAGCEGRVSLLQRLGDCLAKEAYFKNSSGGPGRPGYLMDYLLKNKADEGKSVKVDSLFEVVIEGLQDMWPASRTKLGRYNMGDVWPHSALAKEEQKGSANLVPFHKLSQWLTYSLMEPLQDLGVTFTNLQAMTGLAEYRNGGLFIDAGVLVPKDSTALQRPYEPQEEFIVEWRALTVILLDLTAEATRERLQVDKDQFPLVKVLECGTWKAGRVIAKEKRESGGPPVQIVSDGTVF